MTDLIDDGYTELKVDDYIRYLAVYSYLLCSQKAIIQLVLSTTALRARNIILIHFYVKLSIHNQHLSLCMERMAKYGKVCVCVCVCACMCGWWG